MTYKRSRVSQYNACPSVAKRRREYYPFGLQTSASWTRENVVGNNFLYNQANELNQNTRWYETFFRGYDPALGRFLQVDPLSFSEQATYQYGANNPVMFNDPLGSKAQGPWALKAERMAMMGSLAGWMDWMSDPGGGGFHSHSGGNSTNWADGIKYSDWTLSGGSEMYQKGLAAGLTDVGGTLYSIENDGTLVAAQERNGELGFWMDVYTDHYTEGRLEGSTYEYTYFKPVGNAQQGRGFKETLQRFVNEYFGTTIDKIQTMCPNENDNLTWFITWDVGIVPKGVEGVTDYNPATGEIKITISYTAFKNGPYLALTTGHELVHALDIANGNLLQWQMDFGMDDSPGSPTNAIMEVHAWEWTQRWEKDPRINMPLGDGADAILPGYRALLPSNFTGFSNYNR